jgi:CRISPR/Cas system-associated exonuclease Cas4 (RecB family)
MEVTKKTGEKEKYDPKKLCGSMERAGVPRELAQKICIEIEGELEPQVTTTKIFRETLRYLLKEDMELSARYSLRRAVDDLGPTGFLFEQYVEALLQAYGYDTKRNSIIKGECVQHEVDIFAKKAGINFLVEAKYRNEHNIKTHIDQVMYADARLMDIQRRQEQEGSKENYIMWVITNTKFTQSAITYGNCREVKLVGWNYPRKENFEFMITKKKMYPVTVLPSLTRAARDAFTEKNLILAQDILPYNPKQLQKDFSLSEKLAVKLTKEAQVLLA